MNGLTRAALWAVGLPIVAFPAYWSGREHHQGAGDMAGVGGLGWAFGAVLIYLGIVLTVEVGRLYVQKRREKQLDRIRRGLPPK